MQIDALHTSEAVLVELGRRVEEHRLARNWTQEDLAAQAGIGRATVQRLERGEPVQTPSLLKVLRALGVLAGLDAVLPERVTSPVAELRRERSRQAATRKRASGRHGRPPRRDRPWTWGDETDGP
jgi:transcriptional regulator with XRE-family HTH domain